MARQPEVAGNIQTRHDHRGGADRRRDLLRPDRLLLHPQTRSRARCETVTRSSADGCRRTDSRWAPACRSSARCARRWLAADGSAQLRWSWKSDLAIWTAVVFLVLLAILWKFAWGPIAEGLDKREQEIADQIAEAERSQPGGPAAAGRLPAEAGRLAGRGPRHPRPGPPRRRAARPRDARQGQGRGRGRAAAGPAADRAGHGRRAEGTGRAQRHPGRRAGRQDRRQPAQRPRTTPG